MILFLTMLQASIPLAMRKMISEVTVRQSVLFLTVCVLIYCAVLLLYNVIDVIWMKYLDRLGGKILLASGFCSFICPSARKKPVVP